jgi:hypothetical protein
MNDSKKTSDSTPKPESAVNKADHITRSEAETHAEYPADGVTPPHGLRLPALDKDNMPLPRRVNELDIDATHVTPSAFKAAPVPSSTTTRRPVTRTTRRTATSARRRKNSSPQKGWGCLVRGLLISLFVIVAILVLLVAAGIYTYYDIANSLPTVDDLRSNAAQFETTRILDREGHVLYEINDPAAGKRTYVPLEQIISIRDTIHSPSCVPSGRTCKAVRLFPAHPPSPSSYHALSSFLPKNAPHALTCERYVKQSSPPRWNGAIPRTRSWSYT